MIIFGNDNGIILEIEIKKAKKSSEHFLRKTQKRPTIFHNKERIKDMDD